MNLTLLIETRTGSDNGAITSCLK